MTNYEKRFTSIIKDMSRVHSSHNVWDDFVDFATLGFSVMPPNNMKRLKDTYKYLEGRYSDEELDRFEELTKIVIESLEANPEQDFLGSMYMQLNMGNGDRGQVFTPYHIGSLMTKLTFDKSIFNKKELVRISDPTVGAGALLIAYANECLQQGIDLEKVVFFGQDIDGRVAKMCFIQLCALGCQAVVVVGDSISSPTLKAVEDSPNTFFSPLLCINSQNPKDNLRRDAS